MTDYVGGAGNDAWTITSADGDSMVDGKGGRDTLTIRLQDQNGGGSGSWNGISGTFGIPFAIDVAFTNIETLNLFLGGGDDGFVHTGPNLAAISAGGGDDNLVLGVNDTVDGGAGLDTASFDFSGVSQPVSFVNGGTANTTYVATIGGVAAGSVRNIEIANLAGGAGADRIGGKYAVPAADADIVSTLDGNGGSDTAVLDFSAATSVSNTYDQSMGNIRGYAASGRYTEVDLADIEGVDFTGSGGNDTISFSNLTAASTLRGGGGDDVLAAGTGNHRIDGGTGFDRASFDYSDRTAAVNLVNGAVAGTTYTATVGGVAAGGVANVELLGVAGGAGDDRIGGTYAPPPGNANIGGPLDSFGILLNGNGGTDIAVIDFSSAAHVDAGEITFTVFGAPFTYFGALGYSASNYFTSVALAGIEGVDFTGSAGDDNAAFGFLTADTILRGGAGDDMLIAGSGNSVIDGGADVDTASFDFSARTGAVNLVNGGIAGTVYAATVGGVAAGSVANVEIMNVTGGSADDRIGGRYVTPTASANYTATLEGNGGTDTAVVDFSGADHVTASYTGGTSGTVDGYGGPFHYTRVTLSDIEAVDLTGSGGNDSADLSGLTGDSILRGGAGNDVLTSGTGRDVIDGGDGDDVLNGGVATDTVSYASASSGVAVALYLQGSGSQFTVGAGTDSLTGFENLTGSAFDDELSGDAGDNVIEGGAGNDRINGGSGTDTASYAGAAAGVTVSLASSGAQNTGGAGTDELTNIDNLIGSAFADTLSAAWFTSSGLSGGAGNDVLMGAFGNDTLDGGSGIDLASYAGAASAVTISLALIGPQATGGAGTDTLTGIEQLTGSAYDDALTGDGNANSLGGGAGNDLLLGGAGNDLLTGGLGTDTASYAGAAAGVTVKLVVLSAQNTVGAGTDTLSGIEYVTGSGFDDTLSGDAGANNLQGGDGNDILLGGAGNDILNGFNGIDTASYLGAASGVTVDLTITTAQNTHGAGIDRLLLIENLRGSSFDDILTGNNVPNTLNGAEGNDTLIGNAGNDNLVGGIGNDTLSGGDGQDRVDGGDGNDVVNADNGNDNMFGGNGDDVLHGGAGNDLIDAGAGNDILYGQGGRDTLTGGTGADIFLFVNIGESAPPTAGRDTIADFSHAQGDHIDLSGIDAITGGADNAFSFRGSAAFDHHAGELRVIASGANFLVQADVDGDGAADFAVLVTSATPLTGADFVL